jgi:protein SCO1/2
MSKSPVFKSVLPILLLIGLLTGFGYLVSQLLLPNRRLPVYNPSDVNPDLVDDSVIDITDHHTIADFSVVNQNGDTITQSDYENKFYVANFFFTRCQTICLPMMANMHILQDHYIDDDEVSFLSYSVTPITDSVSVLHKYAVDRGIIQKKWNITTGDKKHIYELARKSYFAVLDEGDGDLQDFIHTERFILVDKKRQIRGFYDGTKEEDMAKIIADISLLKKE